MKKKIRKLIKSIARENKGYYSDEGCYIDFDKEDFEYVLDIEDIKKLSDELIKLVSLHSVSISFIQELILKYEEKVESAKHLKEQGKSFSWNESTIPSKERLDLRIYERNTFIKDLKSLLNEC